MTEIRSGTNSDIPVTGAVCKEFSMKSGSDICVSVSYCHVVNFVLADANFCLELQSRSCNLNFELQTGGRTDTTVVKVAKGSGIRPGKSNGKAEVNSLIRISMDVQGMLSRFFLDAEAAVRMMPGQSPAKLFFNVLRVGSIVQCMDEDLPDVYAHFTNDELYGFCIANNAYTYNTCGASHETNGTYRRQAGMPLMRYVWGRTCSM